MLITPQYEALNRELHERRPDYGTGGHKWAGWVGDFATYHGIKSILDYGCGKGTLKDALPGFDVREYDPCVRGKDARPEPADMVVCTDVLEHVEAECIRSVLADIMGLSRSAVLLGICCKAGGKTLADGRNAHVLVKPAGWWHEMLTEFGDFHRIDGEPYEYNAVVIRG
jgi:hypothetical protein